MDIELTASLQGAKLQKWKDFLSRAGLEADLQVQRICLIWDEDEIIATGSRQDNLLKCIAVDAARQGEGLTATLLTQLRQEAFREGHRHLFLYTKPANEFLFRSLAFYPVAATGDVLLMEDKKDGIHAFLQSLPVADGKTVGAAVMNCDPFTLGHQYLIETAAAECDRLYIFVLSEDKGRFSTFDRLEMVKRGTAHLPNVWVLPTGPYLISSATFPTYFLKDRDGAGEAQCRLDMEIFCKYFAPHFGITRRYVGTEPLSALTRQYNEALAEALPPRGIALRQVSRLEKNGIPVSAGAVREALASGDAGALALLLPETTLAYLKTQNLIG